MISLIILSGRSGSGKSTALHVLEDLGYYCIDNLPVSLLKPLIDRLLTHNKLNKVSVSIDARNIAEDLANFPNEIENLEGVELLIVYLDSSGPTLVKRFSETRRKHPLSSNDIDLRAALKLEKTLLGSISDIADLTIDTTNLTIHELRDLISNRITGDKQGLALLFLSFGFKNGVPIDVDLVFDIRCLPNPHWVTHLRALTGLDTPVQEFLEGYQDVEDMYGDIQCHLEKWLPKFVATNRSYMTIGIGCTGGQHRSVYMSERLYKGFTEKYENIQVRHRELGKSPKD